MSDIFISYSRKNITFARSLFDALQEMQRDSWIDWEDIPYSVDWWHEICTGIDAAHCFVIILTPASLTSKVCNREIAYAIQNNKRIIPVMHFSVDEKQLAEEWYAWNDSDLNNIARANWKELQRSNWLFFRDEDDFATAFSALIQTLDKDPEHVRLHTRLLVRAREWDSKPDKDAGLLLRGNDLHEAEQWLTFQAGKPPMPLPLHIAYIRASIDQRETEIKEDQEQQARELMLQKRSAQILGALVGVFLVAAVIALGLSAYAFNQRNDAQRANATSEYNAQEAVIARETSDSNAHEAENARQTSDYNAMISSTNEAYAFSQATIVAQELDYSESLRLAAAANSMLQETYGNAELAALLSVRALHLRYSPEAETTLQTATQRLYTEKLFVVRLPDPTTFSPPVTAAFSPNGNLLATGTGSTVYAGSGILTIWDVESGERITSWEGFNSFISCLIFSPDGSKLLVCNSALLNSQELSNAQLLDVRTGEVVQTFSHEGDMITTAAFSPDAQRLVTGGNVSLQHNNGETRVWDVTTGNLLATLRGEELEDVVTVAFSADGTLIFTANSYGLDNERFTVRIWEVETNRLTDWEDYPFRMRDIRFSPTGDALAFINAGHVAYGEMGVDAIALYEGDEEGTQLLAFSPDARFLLVTAGGNAIVLIDIETRTVLRTFTGHRGTISYIGFSPDGEFILSAGNDGTARIWRTEPQLNPDSAPTYVFDESSETVRNVVFSADGTMLLAAGDKAYVWDTHSGALLREFNNHPFGEIFNAAFVSQGVVTAGWDLNIILQDSEGNVLRTTDNGNSTANALVASSDGRYLLTNDANVVHIWDSGTGKLIRDLAAADVSDIAISDDNRLVATASNDETVRVWNFETGEELQLFLGHEYWVNTVAISPSGTQVVSGGFDGTVRLWDIQTGQEIRRFEGHTGGAIWAVEFSPDGTQLLTGGQDATARLWDVTTGQEVRRLIGHTELVWAVSFSPDGTLIATSGSDNSVRLWSASSQDTLAFACSHIFYDFTSFERDEYLINDDEPTCPE